MFEALAAHVEAIERDTDNVGLVIIRGAGVAFSAGADLGKQQTPPFPNFQAKTLEHLSALPQPVVAAIHGICFAGGLEVALAADLIFAGESTSFADPHGRWGLVPGWGLSQRLPRRVGTHRARMMSFTGRKIGGRAAEQIGLVDFCVPDAQFETELAALSADIIAQSWHSLRGYKRLYVEGQDLPLSAGLSQEIFRSPGDRQTFWNGSARNLVKDNCAPKKLGTRLICRDHLAWVCNCGRQRAGWCCQTCEAAASGRG